MEETPSRSRIVALAEQARAADHEDEAVILDDGEVTSAELRQAYLDATECMTDRGLRLESFEEYEALHGPEIDYLIGPGRRTEREAEQITTDCEELHVTLVRTGYDLQHAFVLTDTSRATVTECLATKGIATDAATVPDLVRDVPDQAVLGECTREAQPEGPILLVGG